MQLQPGPRIRTATHSTLRAVFFDVDNTLVGNESLELPSARFIAAAQRSQRTLGIGLATARPLAKARYILDAINAKGISILSNGAQIYDHRSSRMLREWVIPIPATMAIAQALAKRGIAYWIQDDGHDYIPPNYQPNKPFVICTHGLPRQEADQVLELADPYRDDNVRAIIGHQTRVGSQVRYHVWFVHAQGNKRNALEEVVRLTGASLQETMAVGDGPNDAVLLEMAGTAVAMGNAVAETKAMAMYIAPDQTSDGAAIALEELTLNPEPV